MAVARLARNAETANSQRAEIRADRLNQAEPNAPTTKPICTEIVSQARPDSSKVQADVSAGTTAEAENQTAIASNSASDIKSSICHLCGRFAASPRFVKAS